MPKPKFIDDEAFKSLRSGDYESFNKIAARKESVDLCGCDLRSVDFRNADMSKVKLKGAYLRDCDLRGKDLRHIDMEGCSLFNARVSGAWFPYNISVDELDFSISHGTRLRVD